MFSNFIQAEVKKTFIAKQAYCSKSVKQKQQAKAEGPGSFSKVRVLLHRVIPPTYPSTLT